MAVNNAGDLRERIRVEYPETVCVAGEDITSWKDLFGAGIMAKVRRKYIRYDDDHGEGRLFSPEVMTVTVRYTRKITSICRIRMRGEVWYIVNSPERSVDGGWLTFTVEKREGAM